MTTAEIVPMFSGDAEAEANAVSSTTFLKRFRAHMRDLGVTGDAERISALQDYLADNSPAEHWYSDLQRSAKAAKTWATLEAAFLKRFPGPQQAERTAQEWERELTRLRLTVDELNTTVKVGGVDVFTHVHFAGRLLDLANRAGIAATPSNIWQARDALPDVLREKVATTQTDWTTFTDAIKAVDRAYIREGVVKAKKANEMERLVKDLAAKNRATPLTPVSKMSAQLAQAVLSTPGASAQQTTPTLSATNPFGQGGGRGNLFAQPQELDKQAKTKLRGIVAVLSRSIPKDDAAGRAEYARRV